MHKNESNDLKQKSLDNISVSSTRQEDSISDDNNDDMDDPHDPYHIISFF